MKNGIKRKIVDVGLIPIVKKSDLDINMRCIHIMSSIGLRICLDDDTRIYIYAQLKSGILEYVVCTVRVEDVDMKVLSTDMQLNKHTSEDVMYIADRIACIILREVQQHPLVDNRSIQKAGGTEIADTGISGALKAALSTVGRITYLLSNSKIAPGIIGVGDTITVNSGRITWETNSKSTSGNSFQKSANTWFDYLFTMENGSPAAMHCDILNVSSVFVITQFMVVCVPESDDSIIPNHENPRDTKLSIIKTLTLA